MNVCLVNQVVFAFFERGWVCFVFTDAYSYIINNNIIWFKQINLLGKKGLSDTLQEKNSFFI